MRTGGLRAALVAMTFALPVVGSAPDARGGDRESAAGKALLKARNDLLDDLRQLADRHLESDPDLARRALTTALAIDPRDTATEHRLAELPSGPVTTLLGSSSRRTAPAWAARWTDLLEAEAFGAGQPLSLSATAGPFSYPQQQVPFAGRRFVLELVFRMPERPTGPQWMLGARITSSSGTETSLFVSEGLLVLNERTSGKTRVLRQAPVGPAGASRYALTWVMDDDKLSIWQGTSLLWRDVPVALGEGAPALALVHARCAMEVERLQLGTP